MIGNANAGTEMVLSMSCIQLLAALPADVVGELMKSAASYWVYGESDETYITCETTVEALFGLVRPEIDAALAERDFSRREVGA